MKKSEWKKLERILEETASNLVKNGQDTCCKNCGVDCLELLKELKDIFINPK